MERLTSNWFPLPIDGWIERRIWAPIFETKDIKDRKDAEEVRIQHVNAISIYIPDMEDIS